MQIKSLVIYTLPLRKCQPCANDRGWLFSMYLESREGRSSLLQQHVETHFTVACTVPIHDQSTHFCCPSFHLLRATTSYTYHDAQPRRGHNASSINTQYLLPNFMQLASSSCVKCQASFPQRCIPGQRKKQSSLSYWMRNTTVDQESRSMLSSKSY